jgi:hypothetical protein
MEIRRLAAVAAADARVRLRRPSTIALVLASALGAWLAIPDPASGFALMSIRGSRALYTSSTLAFATALLLAMLVSLFGFYITTNALARDLRTRIGPLIAATPVRSSEYLLGKLSGNVALLSIVTASSMVAAMAMQVVRGEGPLEPATFLSYYALLLPPCIFWVAVIALVFECAPGLGGRVGDVLYFFVWSLTLALGMEPWRKPGEPISWLGRCGDYAGFGLALEQVRRLAGTEHFSIGYNPVDLARPTTTFPGLDLSAQAWATRSAALVLPLLLLPLALLLFRRFDPARTRARDGGRWRNASATLARLARWIGRPALALLDRLPPDAALSFRCRPLLALVAAASAALGLVLPSESVRQALLPVLFAVLTVALSDVATREGQAGMAATLFAAPGRRREAFAAWKLSTAAVVALVLVGVPAARLLATQTAAGLSAVLGTLFLAASAVALGIATGTPKTFVGFSLALWYLALNARGHTPALDYGGWWASATPQVQAGWALATTLAVALAFAADRLRLARER